MSQTVYPDQGDTELPEHLEQTNICLSEVSNQDNELKKAHNTTMTPLPQIQYPILLQKHCPTSPKEANHVAMQGEENLQCASANSFFRFTLSHMMHPMSLILLVTVILKLMNTILLQYWMKQVQET